MKPFPVGPAMLGACLVLALSTAAAATTWNVPGDGSGTCTIATPSCSTIAAAVAAASANDDVQVAAGVFPEPAIVNVNKALTINGAGAGSTFVEPTSVGFSIAASDVTISNLTVRNGTAAVRFTTNGVADFALDTVDLTNNTTRGIDIQATVTDLSVVDCNFTNNNIGIRMSSNSHVDGLTVTNTDFDTHTLAIYQANDGNTSTLDDLKVSNCTFDNNSSTAAIYAEEIRDSSISGSFFDTNQRGILIFKAYTGSGADVENVAITGNTFTNSSAASIQLISQGQGLGGPITASGNTITQDVGDLAANWGAIDVRLGSGFTHAPITLADNTITLSGTFGVATAAYGIAIRGNGPVTMTGNILDGGTVGGPGTVGAPPSAGIYLRSADTVANFAAIPSGATFSASCNRIGGFEYGVVVFDAVTSQLGNLDAGASVTLTDNTIAGNTIAGAATDADPPTLAAEGNFWGCAAGPGNPGCDPVAGNVDATPAATSAPACVSCVNNADCDDALVCNGVETCDGGTGMCTSGTPVTCDDDNDCTADVCGEPTGTCSFTPVADGSACDDGVTCSIPDTCEAGVCESNGGPDSNMNGTCDADEIGPLTLLKSTVKAQKLGNARGKFVAKGLLPTAPPADDLDTNATITVRIEDGGTLDQSRTFAVGECLPKGTSKVLCRSVDRQAKAVFTAPKSTPGTYKFTVKVGGLAIDPPFASPVTLTVTYDGGRIRQGSAGNCKIAPVAIKCKQ